VISGRDPAIFIIRYDWRNNSVLFVHNLDEKPREISFAVGLPGETGNLLVNLLTEDHSRAGSRDRHRLLMEGYGYRWYRVGGLDYLLKRSDIDTNTTEKASHPA
jgi:maltose alpha-D-glucosyltransferase/alpha-amylase